LANSVAQFSVKRETAICEGVEPTWEFRNLSARRFPPWSVEELDACFVVKDRDGQRYCPRRAENGNALSSTVGSGLL
jgi:hypothetical protein